MTQTEARAPYMHVSVQIPTPTGPHGPASAVSWSATRFGDGLVEIGVYVHPTVTTCQNIAKCAALTLPDVSAWVPRPPSGWLASLRMTAEPDRPETCQGQDGLCGNDETLIGGVCERCRKPADPDAAMRAYLAREGRL